MSVTVCRDALIHPVLPISIGWMAGMMKVADAVAPPSPKPEIGKEDEDEERQRFDIWSSIQKNKEKITPAETPPYIHPLVRQSSSLMSQKSLEICTESLGSETGSYEFSSGDQLDSSFEAETEDESEEMEAEEEEDMEMGVKDISYVNYHCCIGRRSPTRSFPPPLPSISRRDGLCLKMQHHRQNGRLVLEAVPVPSHNYLHAERHDGRLLLSFIDNSVRASSPAPASGVLQSEEGEEALPEIEEEEEVGEVEEEEELEVVDRGTTVEVKVSTQPQAVSGTAMAKIHRSSLVINKFVVGSPLPEQGSPPVNGKRMSMAPTTAAAAAVVASSISTLSSTTEGFQYNYLQQQHGSRWGPQSPAAAATTDAKLLFTSKGRSREELLHDMRRCSELRRPLFIFEQPYCIATS